MWTAPCLRNIRSNMSVTLRFINACVSATDEDCADVTQNNTCHLSNRKYDLIYFGEWVVTYALSLPMEHRPHTTCLHPALSWVTTSIFLEFHLKPTVHISFSRSLTCSLVTFLLCGLAVSAVFTVQQCWHHFTMHVPASSNSFLAGPACTDGHLVRKQKLLHKRVGKFSYLSLFIFARFTQLPS